MQELEAFSTDPIGWLLSGDHAAYVLFAVLMLYQLWRYVRRENGWDVKSPEEE